MGPLGTTEIILIVAVLFLLFGASRLPQLAKSLGQSRKAFKEGMRDAEDDAAENTRNIESADAPKISSLSDEALAEEMRRRENVKQS